jgi:flavin reductase (DIM6/NTAB) family NADH-FMN oxidoreductase RutF/rubredoxin
MDKSAMFTITSGLFVAGVEEGGKLNACTINTAIQATSEPMQMHVTMMKSNLTTQMIRKKGSLTVSVLSLDAPLSIIGNFGMQSGRDNDKFKEIEYKLDSNGNPYLEKNTVAYMSLNVTSMLDLGSHYLFICDVIEAEKTEAGQPMTYADYRTMKKGGKVAKAESQDEEKKEQKQWVCSVCHWVYDGDIPFEELPDDYKCPVCDAPKSAFVAE